MFGEFDKYERMVKSALMRGGIKEELIDLVSVMTADDSFVVVAYTNDGTDYKTVKWTMPLVDGNSDITSNDGRIISAKEERDEDSRRYCESFLADLQSAITK